MATRAEQTGVKILGPVSAAHQQILTPDALEFIAKLQRQFNSRREALLERRKQVLLELRAGRMPDFLPETAHIRSGDWKVAPIPHDLQDRRVEITGP
ncbi:MAG TPA: hypothetical protein VFV50_14465, partial [Bdellovibrionales bacterium]|nr:hypothetical protein [Bdellovibrionales bacterium]